MFFHAHSQITSDGYILKGNSCCNTVDLLVPSILADLSRS